MAREPLVIGPFAGGLNTYDDATAVKDTELVECLNWDPGLEGSLRSRPPFTDLVLPMPLGASGNPRFLGFFYGAGGAYWLIASDGLSSTWAFNGVSRTWSLITATFSATSMAQFDNKAWLMSPVGEADPGGYWTPAGGFVADADMPRGDSIVSFKSRLWVTPGKGNANGTRVYYSKTLGQPNFWQAPSFVDVGQGDGQDIVLLTTWYNTLVAFRSQSIYAFAFNADPAQGTVSLLVPNVGLTSKECLISYEGYMYFMYDEKAYQFVNNNAQQINLKVPFTASSKANNALPTSVSLFNNRAIFHYYDTMYVYSLRTKTWTRWKSPQWGAIGQIMSPAGVLTDEAYVNPSAVLPAPTVLRTNRELNPRGISTGDLNSFGGRLGWVRSFAFGALTAGLPYDNLVRFTSPETGTVAGRGVDSFGNQDLATPGTTGWWIAGPTVTAGQVVTVSRYVRMGSTASATSYTVKVRFHDGAGNWVGSTQAKLFSIGTPSQWQRVWLTAIAPAGAARFSIQVIVNQAVVTTISFMDITGLQIEFTDQLLDAFDGGFTDTPYLDYGWVTPNNSVSTITSKRVSPLLYIADRVTNAAEAFTCEIQTKNYNYQLSSNFKRLFWWGVDAVFRTRIRGWAVPVVHHAQTTWGQLVQGGVTWGQLLGGTWGSPFIGDISVTSDYNLEGTGPVRKFVKMFKSMRFRQVYFRVIFDTDGSIGTAPVNLFTITAYVGSKETVSKTVS